MPSFIAKTLLGVVVAVLLSACASNVTRGPDMSKALVGETTQAGAISIRLTPDAQKLAADNLKFNQDALLSIVRRSLEARNALTREPDAAKPAVEIVVTGFRTRSAFSAVMFGFMAGDDNIKGEVIVRSPQGAELQRFGVSVSYALGGIAGGMDDARMNWLYENFAKHVLEELTGPADSVTPTPPPAVS